MNTLICTSGLPRSGKSTWAKEQGVPIVNPDAIRLALHGQRFSAQAEPFVWAIAKTMVHSLFIAGCPVVILDATIGTRKRRAEWKSKDWKTCFQIIDTPKDECLRRAEGDDEIRPVIERMAAEWEPLGDDEGE